MAWTRVLAARLRALWAGDEVRDEIDEEMRFHIELRTEENIERGMSPEEARRDAERRFGNAASIKDAGYDVRGGGLVETFWRDARFGARLLRKRPGFTAIAVLTLGLGIGANTAIFSVVNGVLLRPLAYHEPENLVTVLNEGQYPVAPADFLDVRDQAESFDRLAAAQAWGGTLMSGDAPEVVRGLGMGDGLFEMLGVPALLGRTLEHDDFRPGADRVVVLGHTLWQRDFGGDPSVVGRRILLTGEPYTVVGVMPAEFHFPPFWSTRAEMWAPLDLSARMTDRKGSSLRVFGRLKPGVSRERAAAEIAAVNRRLVEAYPDDDTGMDLRVTPLADKVVGDVRPALLTIAVAVGLVLLIACANVACLLLVRGQARRQETAVRMALGASRGRVVRQLLAESLVLVLCGAALGLGIAYAGVGWLTATLGGDSSSFTMRLARAGEIHVDGAALAFTLVTALVTSVVFGLAPALAASKTGPQAALREHGRGSTGGGRGLRELLVVGEIALALVLMVGAGLLFSSFLKLRAVDPGFDPRGVLTASISLAGAPQYSGPTREAFYERALDEIRAIPGVESASAINHLPLAGDVWGRTIAIEGRPAPPPGEEIRVVYRVSRPGYFATMGVPLRSGRDFDERDGTDSPGVVVINETLARRQWPGEDAVGRRIVLDQEGERPPVTATVVGVVKDARQGSWEDAPGAELYLPFRQAGGFYDSESGQYTGMTLVVRAKGSPESVAPALRERVRALDRAVPVTNVVTMEQVVSDAIWQPRFNLQLIGLFAGLALVLAALGLYGVMSYAVSQRAREVGLRMALGASRRDVLRLVVGQGLKLAVSGLALGAVAALGLARLMASLLYQVDASDPATFAAVSALLLAVALVACWVPALRAARVDPMLAMRSE